MRWNLAHESHQHPVVGLCRDHRADHLHVRAQGLGLSRMSIPFILGTMVTPDRNRAPIIGFLLHVLMGWLFAFLYALAFESWQRATWWLGGGIGLIHALVVLIALMPILPGLHPRMAVSIAAPSRRGHLSLQAFWR